MTLKELDRLVTKTDMNEVSKKALRYVRSAVEKGKCSSATLGAGVWSVSLENELGSPLTMSFSFRKDNS
jgi:hypothetical protein